jgi:hypothetical protein
MGLGSRKGCGETDRSRPGNGHLGMGCGEEARLDVPACASAQGEPQDVEQSSYESESVERSRLRLRRKGVAGGACRARDWPMIPAVSGCGRCGNVDGWMGGRCRTGGGVKGTLTRLRQVKCAGVTCRGRGVGGDTNLETGLIGLWASCS